MKKLLSLFLAFALFCTLFSGLTLRADAEDAPAVSGPCGENLTWSFHAETGALIISGTGEMYDFEDPDEYEPGAATPWNALRDQIEVLILEDGVTDLGKNAFDGFGITALSLPNSVKRIGMGAFYNCYALRTVDFGTGLNEIGGSSFAGCSALEQLTVPGNVKTIEQKAFRRCGLKNLVLLEGVEHIGPYAFEACRLETAVLPDSLTKVEEYAFSENPMMDSENWTEDGAFYLGHVLIDVDEEKASGEFCVREGTRLIANYAFSGCSQVTAIDLPASLLYFDCGFGLGTVEALTAFSVADENTAFSADASGVLFNADKTVLLRCPATFSGAYAVPSSVSEISDAAFSNCKALSAVELPTGIHSIGRAAFAGCTALTSAKLPPALDEIPDNLFRNCAALTALTMPQTAARIGAEAFAGCERLLPVAIPDQVAEIGDRAFENCKRFTTVTLPNTVTRIGEEVFRYCDALRDVQFPEELVYVGKGAFCDTALYRTRSNWTLTEDGEPNALYRQGVLLYACGLEIDVAEGTYMIAAGVNDEGMRPRFADEDFGAGGALRGILKPEVRAPHITLPASLRVICDGILHYSTYKSNDMFPDPMLPAYTVSADNAWFSSSADGALYNADKTKLLSFPSERRGRFVVPETVQVIGEAAFETTGLDTLVLPATVTEIEPFAMRSNWANGIANVYVLNPDCVIHASTDTIGMAGDWTTYDGTFGSAATIHAAVGSTAEQYAAVHGHVFEPLPEDYDPYASFGDVVPGAYYAEAVDWAVANGVTNGVTAGAFMPNKGCKRSEMITFLWRANGRPCESIEERYEFFGWMYYGGNPFTDVAPENFYAMPVFWATSRGITNGVSGTLFGAKKQVTREQVVTFLWRAAGSPEPKSMQNPFTDVQDGFAKKAILWAVESGITNGKSSDRFAPKEVCTRGQVVTFLYRAYGQD